MNLHIIIAQVAEPISGGAGWVGAGLLGAVLAWLLLKHIPDKDKQVERMMEGRNQVVTELTIEFGKQLKETRDEFKEALNLILHQHDKYITELSTEIKNEFERLHNERNT